MKFQALVNDQAFDLALDGQTVSIDGDAADVSFQRISANEVLLLLDGRSYPFTAEPQDDGTVRLTEDGRREGARRFADAFSGMTGQAHGECSDPDCDCHTDPEAALECHRARHAHP